MMMMMMMMMMRSCDMLGSTLSWWCLIVTVAEAMGSAGCGQGGEASPLMAAAQSVAAAQFKEGFRKLPVDGCGP
jgi:hypothetical protein